jgi:hypothetical protein
MVDSDNICSSGGTVKNAYRILVENHVRSLIFVDLGLIVSVENAGYNRRLLISFFS